jgi:hypothetical protein
VEQLEGDELEQVGVVARAAGGVSSATALNYMWSVNSHGKAGFTPAGGRAVSWPQTAAKTGNLTARIHATRESQNTENENTSDHVKQVINMKAIPRLC